MDFIELWTICSANGIVLDKEQIRKLERYTQELTYWNSKVNLISRKDMNYFLEHHLLHSLSILKYIKLEPKSFCIDVGTGGGLPGIPLAIACPQTYFLLVDSINKKVKITSILAKHTELNRLKVLCSRVEDLANDEQFKHKFDYVITRAVGNVVSIMSKTRQIIKKSSKLIFLKGGNLKKEIEEAQSKFQDFSFDEINIELLGYEWFKNENKKIIIAEKK